MSNAVVTNAEWTATTINEDVVFPLSYDQLVVGAKYVAVIDTATKDDDNSYTILFSEFANGTARRYNTVDGWVDLGGDFFYSTETSPTRKILVLGDDGKVPINLIDIQGIEQIPTAKTYGVFTKDLSNASVQQVIPHALGRVPVRVRFDALYQSTGSDKATNAHSHGIWHTNGQLCIYRAYISSSLITYSSNSTTFALRIYGITGSDEYQTGTVSVDETNIYIDWVINNTPTGIAQIMWEAE